MKKVWVFVLLIFTVLALVIIGCGKKKNVILAPSDFGTATITATASTIPTKSITPTNTPYQGTPTNTPVYSPTITPTTPPPHPLGWIDDCDDTYAPNANDFTLTGPVLNHGGYWITYDDNSTVNNGTSYVWPESATWAERKGETAGPFTMTSPGNNGSFACARVTGYVDTCAGGAGSNWLDTACALPGITTYWPPYESGAFRFGFIGMGCQLTPTAGEGNTNPLNVTDGLVDDPTDCQEVDVTNSGFTGIQFYCKGDGLGWRMKIPYTNQLNCDGKNGTLAQRKACNYAEANDVGFNFTPTGTWTLVQIPFTSLTHESWGFTCSAPGADCTAPTVLKHVKQLQFQTFGDPAAVLDYPTQRELEVDDIQFY
jgi:hypothetical protein